MNRKIVAFFLSLVLALTSHSAAVANGSSAAVDQMVICTGLGATVIYTDAEGQPTSAPHRCPDCVMHVGAGLLPEVGAPLGLATASGRLALPRAQVDASSVQALSFLARGPPDLI
jgi:hypothetical protein